MARLKSPAAAGSEASNSSSTLSRQSAPYDASAGALWQWFGRAPFPDHAQAGLEMRLGCAGYPTWIHELFDSAYREPAQGLTTSWKFSENFANAWEMNSAAPWSAFAPSANSSIWNSTKAPTPAAQDMAAEVRAEPNLMRIALAGSLCPLLAYAGYLAALALLQKRFVFNPTHADGPAAEPADTHEIAPVRLALAHNEAIKGWFFRPRQGRLPCPSIIYHGGRTEEVSWLQGAVKWFPNHAVLALNYRGYGESDGDPSEAGLFEDGLAQFDWLAAQPGVDPKAIVLVGRSLGTGVVSYVAANRPAERVVLITPYDSLLALARRRFWFTPLSLLLRHKFKSVDYARASRQPCLALLAEHDDVVPEEHTHRLMAAWAGAKKLVRIPSTTHLDIPYKAATLTAVATWLGYASVPPGPLSLIGRAT